MKKRFKIFAAVAVVLSVQACGSKTENSSKEEVIEESTSSNFSQSTLEEMRALIKKDSARIAKIRMDALDKMLLEAPTFTNTKGDVIYHRAEVDPSFVGGNKAMMKYLRDNLVYPEQAEDDQLEGEVFVDFVVATNGSVSVIDVTDATSSVVDQAFRNEAIRVVASMPNWLPGRQNDQPVNVKFSIPITFRIR
ncbi:energy transducer TonB [Reichenbachiella sp. MALMAid0571]|uniref:energy transducer TonB n=1 Tax=Reichenbachiella sp. MALMAid0571 TaxID=3143939 RepID=UPI0032DF9704